MSEPTASRNDSSAPSASLPSRNGFGGPVTRQHASDQVFKELASAILHKQLQPGSPLPPERELSERFGVSRIVVREAVHRLKEYELVRVRQGSPTLVLDPDRCTDIRLLGLEIELMPGDQDGVMALAERQLYAGAALLDLAEQRMPPADIDSLDRLIEDFVAAESPTGSEVLAFEREFWARVANGSRNRIFVRETLWFFNLIEREERFARAVAGDPDARATLYKGIVRAMRQRKGSAALYLGALRADGSNPFGTVAD